MSQAHRVLQLLRNMPIGTGTPRSTAAALATEHGVTLRTIHRDIAELQDAGFAVCNEGHGYYLLPTQHTGRAGLEDEQVALVLYALRWAECVLPPN
ncbi:MAG: HTH domain-containing protein [Armatimonadetes bacterium]|nr:HTH domain-containing protein [Armatimonadota bacterium]